MEGAGQSLGEEEGPGSERACRWGFFPEVSRAESGWAYGALGSVCGEDNPDDSEQECEQGGRRRNMSGQSGTRPLCPGLQVWVTGFPSEAWLVPAPASTPALLVPRPWVVSTVKP